MNEKQTNEEIIQVFIDRAIIKDLCLINQPNKIIQKEEEENED